MDMDFKMNGSILMHYTYVLILPFFFLGSAILYNPFDIQRYYSFGSMTSGFHLVMISCIIMLCELATRTILYFYLKEHDFKWWHYYLWCCFEIFLMAAFTALYTHLFKGEGGIYFILIQDCLKFIGLSLCYPYLFLILVRKVRIRNDEIARLKEPNDSSLVRFYDEHKRLKLSIAPSSILYVSTEYNYIIIHYLDAEKVKEFKMRASLKSLEAINSKNLVRCQRSFFVNPEHISVLRRDPEGLIFAELNIPNVPPVPVSKQYYNSLSESL